MKKVFMLMALVASALNSYAYDAVVDGIYYDLNNGEAIVTFCDAMHEGAYSGDVVIPASITVDGTEYPVTVIDMAAFANSDQLTSVFIPNSVVVISEDAFELCTSLSEVRMPETMEWIGVGAFRGCESLTSIVVPQGVKTVPISTFAGCSNLSSVELPETLTRISMLAFSGCDKLVSLTILAVTPPELSSIAEAFSCYGTLHVKKGCKEAYSNAPYWQNFSIVEDADQGTSFISGTGRSMMETERVGRYDLQGRRMAGSIDSLPAGIYVVNGKKVVKQ